MHFIRQLNCWSLRCSWSIACRRCSNYIFILDLTPGFNILCKDNCKQRQGAFKFWDLVWLILEILWYIQHFPRIMHMVRTLLCFVVVRYWLIFPTSFRITPLALGQSYDWALFQYKDKIKKKNMVCIGIPIAPLQNIDSSLPLCYDMGSIS